MGNCPICQFAFQVGDQVLFFLSSQVLKLSLLLADPVPWLPWVASPRLSPWMPFRMALEVPNDLFRPMSASSSCYFLSLCAHFYCSPLPGTPPALCADRGLATMEDVSRSKMVATRNSLIWASTTEEWSRNDDYWFWYQHPLNMYFSICCANICLVLWIFVLSCLNFVDDTINFLDIPSYPKTDFHTCVTQSKWVGWHV